MFTRTIAVEDLARLKEEREAADRDYNAALSALDGALPGTGDVPHPPPGPDEHQVTPLNQSWDLPGVVPDVPVPGGWRGRLAAFAWGLVAPYVANHLAPTLARQQAFNSHLVDHVNRNVPVGRATRESLASTLAYVEGRMRALETFHSHLLVFLQRVTPFVDTKDYEFSGLTRRMAEDNREVIHLTDQRIDLMDHRTIGLGGAISGVGDELAKRWESMVAREKRYDAAAAQLRAAHDELRSTFSVLHQTHLSLKRELERLRTAPTAAAALQPGAATTTAATTAPVSTAQQPTAATTGSVPARAAAAADFQQAGASTIDSYKYVGFEERFRGSTEEIRRRLVDYLPLFQGAGDVLDLGCGRGEFLELLRGHGVSARGLDLNHEMVEVCRERGLVVDEGDAVGFLESLPDGSLGGLFAAQVVEHLQPDYLLRLLDVAYHKLRPGSKIVLETINPACWYAFFQSYIRDLTHVRPVHPETLGYFLEASGFQKVRVDYRAPLPERAKLRTVTGEEDALREAFNANVNLLNALMFTHMDYAAIGERM
jgi:O-antigen chain-terminating methyltransferase